MMAEGIRYTVDFDDGGLGRAMQNAIARAQDLRPILEKSGGLLLGSIADRFGSGRGPDGIPWPPSGRAKEKSLPQKKGPKKFRMGPNRGGQTLVDSGALRASMRSEVTGNTLEVGSSSGNASAKYARVHQFGATITGKNGKPLVFTAPDGSLVFTDSVTIPARPFIGIDRKDISDLEDMWTDAIKAAFK